MPNGDQLGVMSSREALSKAKELGLDLVEISAQAEPPVCKIIDYGKFKYEQAKLQKSQKTKSKSALRVKEIKLRVGTGDHDYNIKMNRAEGFLDTGHKVRFILQFKGRENAHRELGFVVMTKIVGDMKTMAQIDQAARLNGRFIGMTLSPLPQGQRKRKFQLFHGELFEEDPEDDEDHGFSDDDDQNAAESPEAAAEAAAEAAQDSEETAPSTEAPPAEESPEKE